MRLKKVFSRNQSCGRVLGLIHLPVPGVSRGWLGKPAIVRGGFVKRSERLETAKQTVEIVDRGVYTLGAGRQVSIKAEVAACLNGTRFYEPAELEALKTKLLAQAAPGRATQLEVVNETTLAGVGRLLASGSRGVAALNFASAKNPGGGFLNGSQAQEESLARSSALYASLQKAWVFYERHRGMASCLYSDAMIYSPACPVFRDDAGRLLESPYLTSFITSPAPNAGAIANNAPAETAQIPDVLLKRSEYLLALAAAQGHEDLVLGAWGCGVFRNEPATVAGVFAHHLKGAWAGRFGRVVFSVLDSSAEQETYGAFKRLIQV
jgi:uncharacterized protein (TIGR02452 family)